MLGLSPSFSSLSSSNKSLLTLSTKDKTDAFQNRDTSSKSRARAMSSTSTGVNGAIFKAVWDNPLLTISQKEALMPSGLIILFQFFHCDLYPLLAQFDISR